MKTKQPIILKYSKIVGLVFFALFFYFSGYLIGHRNLVFEANYRPKVVNKELVRPREVDFSIFWKAWELVQEKYVGEFDPQKMIYGAVQGMVSSLGDPFSSFMEPSQTKSFFEDLAGEIEGIGAEISLKENILTIISPLSDSPAQKAGLKPNDKILKINNESTENMALDTAISKIRGKANTEVTLSVIREGWSEAKEIVIKRQKIKIKSVEWEIKADNVAYIKISQFGDDTVELMKSAAKEIEQKKAKAIVLDLRNNPGGYLDAAVDITSLFIDKGVVVKEKFKDGHIENHETSLEPILKNYKTIVLTNGGSASASEILAGALQDNGRATLVGEKTFGKGSVQTLENLPNGAVLRITIAKWLTPKDRAIDGKGIEPDHKIELTEEDQKNNRDPQLDKAMELAK